MYGMKQNKPVRQKLTKAQALEFIFRQHYMLPLIREVWEDIGDILSRISDHVFSTCHTTF